jgi:hypothetical protein
VHAKWCTSSRPARRSRPPQRRGLVASRAWSSEGPLARPWQAAWIRRRRSARPRRSPPAPSRVRWRVRNRATAAQRLSSLRGKTARGRRCGSCTGEAPPGRPCARPAGVERCSSRSRSVAIPIDAKAYGRPLLVNARPCNRSSPHSCSGRPGELTGAAADRPDPISQIRGLRMNALRLG